VLDLTRLSSWLLAAVAALAWGLLAATIVRVLPRRQRPRELRLGAFLLASLVAIPALAGARGELWIGTVVAIALAGPMLFYPRMPQDFPAANDPRRRRHPAYRRLYRRGLAIGVVFLVLAITGIGLTAAFVRTG
jgi:hypothetical protein